MSVTCHASTVHVHARLGIVCAQHIKWHIPHIPTVLSDYEKFPPSLI